MTALIRQSYESSAALTDGLAALPAHGSFATDHLLSSGGYTATRALKLSSSAAAGEGILSTEPVTGLTMVANRTYYLRSNYFIPSGTITGTGALLVLGNGTGTTGWYMQCLLKTDGHLWISMVNDGSGELGSLDCGPCLRDQWFCLEMSGRLNSSGNDAMEMRVDGNSLGSVTNVDIGAIVPTFYNLLYAGDGPTAWGINSWCNDFAMNDDQGSTSNSWCGVGIVGTLLPSGDHAIGSNWLKPGGGTPIYTNLNTRPPAGVAQITTGTAKQIYNIGAASSNYDVDFQSFTTAGIPTGSTINAVQVQVATGSNNTTDTAGALYILSNPTQTSTAFTTYDANAVAGTFPTGWQLVKGPIASVPTVTLGTQPSVRLAKTTANTRAAIACYMAIMADFTLPVPPPDTPTGLAATPGDTQNVLTWDSQSDADGFRVYRIFQDSFTRADSTGLGSNWSGTGFTKSLDIVSNQAKSPTGIAGDLTVASFGPDSLIEATWDSFSGSGTEDLYIRYNQTSGGNGYLVDFAPASFTIYKVTNGTVTPISGNIGYTGTDGDRFRFTANSTALTFSQQIAATGTWAELSSITDATTTAAGAVGMSVNDGGALIDDVIAGTLIYDGTNLTFTDTGLTNGITYSYVILAYNSTGESSLSSIVTGTPTSSGSTVTGVVTASATSSVTSSAVVLHQAVANLTGVSSATIAGQLTHIAAASLIGTSSATIAGTDVRFGQISAVGISSATIDATNIVPGIATATGTSSATIVGSRQQPINIAITGTSSATINANTTASGAVSIIGTSSVATTTQVIHTGVIGVMGAGTVTVAGQPLRLGQISAFGTSSATISAIAVYGAATSIVGTSSVSTHTQLTANAVVSATGMSSATSTGLLALGGNIIANGLGTIDATANVTHNAQVDIIGTSSVRIILDNHADIFATSALGANGSVVRTDGASLTGTSSAVIDGQTNANANASLVATSAVTAAGTRTVFGSSSIVGTSSVIANSVGGITGQVTASANGTIVVQGTVQRLDSGILSATGTVTVNGSIIRTNSSVIQGTSSVTVGSSVEYKDSANLQASGSVSVSGSLVIAAEILINALSSASAVGVIIGGTTPSSGTVTISSVVKTLELYDGKVLTYKLLYNDEKYISNIRETQIRDHDLDQIDTLRVTETQIKVRILSTGDVILSEINIPVSLDVVDKQNVRLQEVNI